MCEPFSQFKAVNLIEVKVEMLTYQHLHSFLFGYAEILQKLLNFNFCASCLELLSDLLCLVLSNAFLDCLGS